MKYIKLIFFVFVFTAPIKGISQYTDVINSNRPGLSVSAYAVGKNVLQAEFGASYENKKHSILERDSKLIGADLSIRYGLLFEELEIVWDGTFLNENISFTDINLSDEKITDFYRNRLGLKYLVYDPYKSEERNKPNIHSWRANHKFQWRNLVPAISVYVGANFVLGDNPFFVNEATVSPRAMIATQSRISPRVVLISNIAYDRIGTDFPEWSYLISLSHAFKNPKWSFFVENQGIKSDRYSDNLLRGGIAHLLSKKFQVDVNVGANFKNSPSKVFGAAGLSYRLDMHKDVPKPISSQKSNQKIKKNSNKVGKKKTKKKTKKGPGEIEF